MIDNLPFLLTDTVGFIRRLPAELIQAFMATLEELSEADLLIHVVDVSNPAHVEQVKVVENILNELELGDIPCIKLYNKIDLLKEGELLEKLERDGEFLVSALKPETIRPFLIQAEKIIGKVIAGEFYGRK